MTCVDNLITFNTLINDNDDDDEFFFFSIEKYTQFEFMYDVTIKFIREGEKKMKWWRENEGGETEKGEGRGRLYEEKENEKVYHITFQ